ncbi:hypothetical protein BDK51DRAFT_40810 [Blyttiomyces helicus]|uniref:F-box domain-containing protein n=1 Tax=Blyttiomyces helicus TaxID=388810 RepID=A0A4P9W749_9FUNG|nr:hypothetical protein BDK51DRAFT_40810 [Blyttiomyces helicus]|eukprot:RKO88281.1 hypothetical protein BDK51DRAFT_40810 [Blyttiomyces helicus]
MATERPPAPSSLATLLLSSIPAGRPAAIAKDAVALLRGRPLTTDPRSKDACSLGSESGLPTLDGDAPDTKSIASDVKSPAAEPPLCATATPASQSTPAAHRALSQQTLLAYVFHPLKAAAALHPCLLVSRSWFAVAAPIQYATVELTNQRAHRLLLRHFRPRSQFATVLDGVSDLIAEELCWARISLFPRFSNMYPVRAMETLAGWMYPNTTPMHFDYRVSWDDDFTAGDSAEGRSRSGGTDAVGVDELAPAMPNTGWGGMLGMMLVAVCASPVPAFKMMRVFVRGSAPPLALGVTPLLGPMIRKLALHNLSLLIDADIVPILLETLHLTHFEAYGCERLTDITLYTLARYCPNLTELLLPGAHLLSDMSLLEAARTLHALTSLDLRACPSISDAGLVPLLQSNERTLRRLNVGRLIGRLGTGRVSDRSAFCLAGMESVWPHTAEAELEGVLLDRTAIRRARRQVPEAGTAGAAGMGAVKLSEIVFWSLKLAAQKLISRRLSNRIAV